MIKNGIDAVLIEDYFGDCHNVERVLQHLYVYYKNLIYGVNILKGGQKWCYEYAFDLANQYDAKFIQVDSVAGHLDPYYDMIFNKKINELRNNSEALVLGGVRFKYQPVKSMKTVEEDLRVGRKRCDVIVVTGEGTGLETDLDKIKSFKEYNGDFPTIVGAGLNPRNCYDQLSMADGGIVGSYLKEGHKAEGELVEDYVIKFMEPVKTLRKFR